MEDIAAIIPAAAALADTRAPANAPPVPKAAARAPTAETTDPITTRIGPRAASKDIIAKTAT